MTDEIQNKKVSDMIRETANNQNEFLQQIANHIDKLESDVLQLHQRITELEESQK